MMRKQQQNKDEYCWKLSVCCCLFICLLFLFMFVFKWQMGENIKNQKGNVLTILMHCSKIKKDIVELFVGVLLRIQ